MPMMVIKRAIMGIFSYGWKIQPVCYGRTTTGKYSLNPSSGSSPSATAATPTAAPRVSVTTTGPTSAVKPSGKTAVTPYVPGSTV